MPARIAGTPDGGSGYVWGGWSVANKTTNTTQQAAVDGTFYFAAMRTGSIQGYSHNQGVASAGSALTVQVSVDGGANWTTIYTVGVGVSAQAARLAAPIAVTAAALVGVRYVTDASWTSTTADPQTWLDFV